MPIGNSTDRFNGVVASLAIKVRCVVAAESNVDELQGITNPYSGINVVDGDRILLVAQTDAIENGVWDVHDPGLWTRAFDWDGNRDVEKGSTVWAGQSGGRDKLWQLQTAGVVLPGSTAQTITILFDPETAAGGQPNPIILPEIAGAGPDVPGEGQIWVRDDGPNVLMFTDDAGDDFVINVGGLSDRLVDGASNVAVIALGSGISAIRSVGNLVSEGRDLYWQHSDGTTQFSIGSEFFTDMIFRNWITGRHMLFQVGIGGGNRTRLRLDGDQTTGGVQIYAGTGGQPKLETTPEGVEIKAGTLFIFEQAAQEADQSQFGQIWVDSSDDSLHYVTEAGVDFDLTAIGGGGGVTVEDEGVPLATVANTLDFVGAGVVASGAGTTKTITIPGGVGTPAGANEQIQYNDNGAFGATSFMEYDVSQGSIILDVRNAGTFDGAIEVERMQEGATGLKIQSGNGNTTFHNIWQDFDPNFESSFKLRVDSTAGVRLLQFIDDPDDVFIEMDAFGADIGRIRFGGHDTFERVFMDFNNDVLAVRNSMTLYIEELAAANPEVALHGQIWVRSDTPNVLMFTDDAGTDFVLNAGGGAEVNDLSVVVTWANIPDANVPESAVTQHEAAIDHDNLANFVADEHIDWSVTGAEDIHVDRLPAPQTFVMVTPISISLGSDDVFETISDGTLAAAGATHALIKCFCQIAPTGSNFATQVLHLRETGSAIAKATSNRAAMAAAEDASAQGASADTNDAWVELNGSQDFDILQDQAGTGTSIAQAWIVGYMA